MSWFRKPSSTPLWRDEFSVYTADERYVNRRQFTKFLTLTSFGMFAGNLWVFARSVFHRLPSYPQMPVATTDELGVGGVKIFAYPTADDPCILVRDLSGRLDAYSQVCTHLSCAVVHRPDERALACPCHKGSFSSADGQPLAGPPTRRLPRIVIEQRGDEIVATGIEV